ncbi:UNVERIFIED_CONTAM: hypothetical protein K2H54_000293 [Gekko kuhli]
MIIAPVIFCTVVTGIAGMESMKAVGKTGAIALLYFEVAKAQGIIPFLLDVIPGSVIGAFASGNILQVLLFAVLFGFSLHHIGEKGKVIFNVIDSFSQVIFGIINMIMRLAPMEAIGCKKSVVGLVIPTGYSFNLDGTSIYLTMAAIFIAQATNTPLDLFQQITLLVVLLISSKGAAGVTGSGFIVLAATISAVGHLPLAGLALILGIDRFMSEARALTNLIGNGVATLVVARYCDQLDEQQMHEALSNPPQAIKLDQH